MSVEKINSEELKKMLGRSPMSDDELENISGGMTLLMHVLRRLTIK